jgi:hypothetical protein
MDWIDVAQEMDKWKALVNMVIFAQPASSQKGLTSTELVMYQDLSKVEFTKVCPF